MTRRLSLVVVVLLLLSSLMAWAVAPIAPIIYSAVRTGAATYAVKELPTLVGESLKWLEATLDANIAQYGVMGVRVPLSAKPENAPPAPAAAPSVALPGSTVQTVWKSNYVAGSFGDESACISAVAAASVATCVSYGYQQSVCEAQYPPSYFAGSCYQREERVAGTCPSGYTSNGSVCNLTDARAAVADGYVDLSRNGESLVSASANDPDRAGAPSFSTDNGRFAIAGRDAAGNVTQTQVIPVAGGGSQVVTQTQQANGTIAQTVININGNGVITDAGHTTVQGSLSIDPATGTATAVAAPQYVNPDGSVSTLPTVQFPSDYARVGEAAAAANALGDRLLAPQDIADPVVPGNDQWTFFGDSFNALMGWQLPGHSSQCPVSSFSWNGSTYTVDAHCQLIQNHWTVLEAAMLVVWTVVALFIVLGA